MRKNRNTFNEGRWWVVGGGALLLVACLWWSEAGGGAVQVVAGGGASQVAGGGQSVVGHYCCWLVCGGAKQVVERRRVFYTYVAGCVNENEFENCWKSMVSKYGLEDHAWFRRLYELKEKWCTALSKDFFSAGTLNSQRSESTNHAIWFNAKKTTSLMQFYKIFKETVKRWRSNEEQDEFQASTSYPTSILPMTGLLKHAAEVYTKALFKDFET
nr:protein FAR1-RELATED SEQUENCE 5-like [Ipomoea batatas]